MIKEGTKVADIIEENHLILPVINRFGIKLGVGDLTVRQMCEKEDINQNFFLAVLNAFNNENFFPEEEFHSFSTYLILDYLKKTHHYYLSYVVPRIDNRLEKLVKGSSAKKNIQIIQSYYQKYRKDLLEHIREEEEVVFPYVTELQEAYDNNLEHFEHFKQFNIEGYEHEHHVTDDKLIDLKHIMIKYLQPDYDINDGNEFLNSVFQFEKDLKDHSRIEENILTPRVIELERRFRKV